MAMTEYTESDFVRAVQQLMPPGDYWASDSEEEEGLTESLGRELYKTYLENKLLFLNQDNRSETNWRIADYQALLDLYQKGAVASDDAQMPSVIDIKLSSVSSILSMLTAVEQMRLPHTVINWKLPLEQGVATGIRMLNYHRIEVLE